MSFLGLVNKKPRWGLTWKGWLVVIFVLSSWIYYTFQNIVPFLTAQAPIDAELLVIEGYIPDYALPGIIREYRSKPYKMIITTGVWYPQGTYLAQFKTAPDVLRYSLIKLGIDPENIVSVPLPRNEYRDRTYQCAMSIKKYLAQNRLQFESMNLYSVGVHGRRSRYLFEKALGDQMEIGNIVALEITYNPDRWYKTSTGFRTVTDEMVAWLYARVLFVPD